jgi:hypothetical protein
MFFEYISINRASDLGILPDSLDLRDIRCSRRISSDALELGAQCRTGKPGSIHQDVKTANEELRGDTPDSFDERTANCLPQEFHKVLQTILAHVKQ